MRPRLALVLVPLVSLGCAVGSQGERQQLDFAMGRLTLEVSGAPRPGVVGAVAGEARVIDSHVHPMQLPATLAFDSVQRVALGDGRFLECWVEGSVEWGNRALARSYEADGTPRGATVVLSPADADVSSAPRALAVDGRRVIATFLASVSGTFEIMAVPVEVL